MSAQATLFMDSNTALLQTDIDFVSQKLEKFKPFQVGDAALEQGGEFENFEETFKTYQQLFDEVIERLPASGPLLARIKREYESTLGRILGARQEASNKTRKLLDKKVEMATISNYLQRTQELEMKLTKIKADNTRIKSEMAAMKKERTRATKEKERKIELLKERKPQMTSEKRRTLRLSIDEATCVDSLQQELQRAKAELTEAREVTEKKYVSGQRKEHLQHQLQEKESSRVHLAAENKRLATQFKNLKLSIEAAENYRTYLKKHALDPSQLSLANYIKAVVASHCDDVEEISDEEPEDPAKEMEAEMILDSFEKFNNLFESELYEEAAVHAATSPRGVLRTMDTLLKFKNSARHQAGQKLPLLSYCEALLMCAPAYRQLSLEESMHCVECVLEHGEVSMISHWIAQGSLSPSFEVGNLIFQHCKCPNRCTCGCKSLAYTIFDKCGAHQQAALCLAHQGRFVAFLSLTKKRRFNKQDFASILYSYPTKDFAKLLVTPPSPYQPILNVFEAMHLLLRGGLREPVVTFLQDYLRDNHMSVTQAVMNDDTTRPEVWESLLTSLNQAHLSELAAMLLALLIVKECFSEAMEHVDLVTSVPPATETPPQQHYQSQPTSQQDTISNTTGEVFQSRPLTSETGSIYTSGTSTGSDSDDNNSSQYSSSEYESGSEESTDVEDDY